MAPLESWLPTLNTSLIVVSGFFLVLGYGFIRARRITWHKRSMLTATLFAALFLVVYVTRALTMPTKAFPGEGTIKTVYLIILVSHTIIAALVGPFALVTLWRALRGRFAQHRGIARITFPMWAYTAVTGWIVYFMLYHLV